MAFGLVYNSGLNEYALYLDCEGQRRSSRVYERTMSLLFRNYRNHPHTHKVTLQKQVFVHSMSVLHLSWVLMIVFIEVFSTEKFLHHSGGSPTLHQQHSPDELAEQR